MSRFQESFRKAQQWLQELEKEFSPGEVVVMLVGNKTDLGAEREVMLEVGLGAGHCVCASVCVCAWCVCGSVCVGARRVCGRCPCVRISGKALGGT